MSERLEIIKFLRNSEKMVAPGMQPSELISRKDVDWLINRVEELEEREKLYKEVIQSYGRLADGFIDDIESLVKRNEHYKQALEEIARGRFTGASYKARQALEGDDD
jgi:CCR4-NOT transcriptional regulation complex NOT5 subunit